jgi:RNA polymerase sigma-70 factor, ECF subfamily
LTTWRSRNGSNGASCSDRAAEKFAPGKPLCAKTWRHPCLESVIIGNRALPCLARSQGMTCTETHASRAPEGDGTVCRVVFEEHHHYVRHVLRRFGVQGANLEDLLQEVFVTFHLRGGDYDPVRPLRPWLGGIALRVAVAHRRLARHSAEVLGWEVEDVPDSAPLPDQNLSSHQDYALVIEALDAVALDRRIVLTMYEIDGVAMPEIAHALEIPVGTAWSRLRLARDDFKAAVTRLRASGSERTSVRGRLRLARALARGGPGACSSPDDASPRGMLPLPVDFVIDRAGRRNR